MANDNVANDVFSRTAADGEVMSDGAYNLAMGLVLCWGFLVNWWMVRNVPVSLITGIDIRLFLLGYFASCFAGVYLFNRSSNPGVSFLGYNLVVIPFGFVINVVVARYDSALVLEAIRITGTVTLGMMLLGSLFPAFFRRIHTALTISLLLVILVELADIFIFHKQRGIIDWIVVLIFCGYVGYDWGRANNIPKTLDNAVDSAAALYMDIINLFLRILRILGRRRR
ncbi:MAG: Bax inhibitor-1 family protein [Elusimicrobia bacterium]|nr:Bax inhibitor-1 family protein [Elusimicrobiota bacterium]